LEKRRANSSFLSDSEAIRERGRTQAVIESSTTKETNEKKFVTDESFWKSWKGKIVRAIALNRAFTKSAILDATKLKEEQFEKALEELFQAELIINVQKGEFRVIRDLYKQCWRYFGGLQDELLDWVQKWKKQKRRYFLESKLAHFYLTGNMLSKFSESLIEHANQEILVTSPFFKRCHISNALMSKSEKGITVRLLTRYFDSEQFKKEVLAKGVFVTYDESIHAKLIVVDRCVAIVSSMNFYAGSSGGACWEAGIATVHRRVVESIFSSIVSKL
jgi:hypothetical protein